MSRQDMDALLAALPAEWVQVEGEGLDADGLAEIVHVSGVEATLSHVPEPGDFAVLYALLGTPEDAPAVYRSILEAAHLWTDTGAVTIGLRPGTDELAAFTSIPLGEGLSERFATVAQAFADDCLKWAGIVAGADENAAEEDHIPIDPIARA